MPLRIPSAPPFIRHSSRKTQTSVTPVVPLTLVAAYYSPGDSVTLEFDRAINIDAIDVSAFVVSDGEAAMHYTGIDVALVDPSTAMVMLGNEQAGSPAGIHLTAGANNGIVSSEDPTLAWAGARGGVAVRVSVKAEG